MADAGTCIPAVSGPPYAPLCVPGQGQPCCPARAAGPSRGLLRASPSTGVREAGRSSGGRRLPGRPGPAARRARRVRVAPRAAAPRSTVGAGVVSAAARARGPAPGAVDGSRRRRARKHVRRWRAARARAAGGRRRRRRPGDSDRSELGNRRGRPGRPGAARARARALLERQKVYAKANRAPTSIGATRSTGRRFARGPSRSSCRRCRRRRARRRASWRTWPTSAGAPRASP